MEIKVGLKFAKIFIRIKVILCLIRFGHLTLLPKLKQNVKNKVKRIPIKEVCKIL